jgi:16S rRNA (cytosine967-C5)-methyltransferase
VENGFQTALLNDPSTLPQLVESTSVYIQNATPSLLMHTLNEHAPIPKRILDLCASPGGKLLLAHDLYPHASLHANDVSSQKLERLKENIIKYNLKAALSCGLGEKISSQELFDLIIIDAPCSNTGVLNKRPEARWRVAENTMKETTDLQFELLKHAETLLAPKGELWYLTCSILPEENEKMMNRISQATHLKPRVMKTMLPTHTGWDGGFGCALVKI